ncbi:alpha/beta hydrolase family protein [Chitinophaga cymbidii]|uniref:alpha/beta hydrolase family protein n=1 Tax=Chitinophaga cymbidii TaxID=1096750 RepID=UPI0011BE2EB1|nr:alpha/beta fold hydrolase [Chitinophaga cymbidii]
MKKLLPLLLAIVCLVSLIGLGFRLPGGLLTYIDKKGDHQPVKTKSDWTIKRAQILDSMQQVMGPLPAIDHRKAPQMEIKSSEKRNGYTRLEIRFLAAPGEWVPAYLYIPEQQGAIRKLPAMLVLHGTGAPGKKIVDGASPKPNRAHARELAERGYVVIAPDYPGMGDLADHDFHSDRYQSGTMKALFSHIRCIDLLASRNDVDPERIGVLGHSLGGHNAMFAAAFDKRLKVVVASCGWTKFDHYNIGEEASKRYGGRLGPWAQDRYMPLIRDRYKLENIPFDFPEVIAAIAPRAFFSNSPVKDGNFDVEGVKKGIREAAEVYQFLGAAGHLQVRYPDAGHDFPEDVRMEAYRYIDEILR